jgi:hypothetical protein
MNVKKRNFKDIVVKLAEEFSWRSVGVVARTGRQITGMLVIYQLVVSDTSAY